MKLRYLPLLLLAAAPAFAADPEPAAPAAPAAPESAAFSKAERDVFDILFKEIREKLSHAGIDANAPISIVAIAGDRDRYLEGRVKNAVTAAGLTYVEGRSDPMWEEIVNDIIWDWRKNDVLDAATLVKFGSLKATRQLLYGHLLLDADKKGRPQAELTLHISSVVTKEHVWGDTFRWPATGPNQDGNVREPFAYVQEPVESLLTVQVRAADGTDDDRLLADRLIPIAENALVGARFKVVDADNPDVVVLLEPKLDAKDRTADFVAFRGHVPVSASLPVRDNRSLGSTRIEQTGGLVQDEAPALSDLVSKIEKPLCDWLVANVTPEKCGLRVITVPVSYRDYDSEDTSARITQFCEAANHLDGVVSCTLMQRLPAGNHAVYRVVYEAGAFDNGFLHALIAKNPELELIVELSK